MICVSLYSISSVIIGCRLEHEWKVDSNQLFFNFLSMSTQLWAALININVNFNCANFSLSIVSYQCIEHLCKASRRGFSNFYGLSKKSLLLPFGAKIHARQKIVVRFFARHEVSQSSLLSLQWCAECTDHWINRIFQLRCDVFLYNSVFAIHITAHPQYCSR